MNCFRGYAIRFSLLIVLICPAWSAPAWSGIPEYCWRGVCYASLAEAEGAMRAHYGAAGKYLENYRTTLAASSRPYTRHYAVDVHPLESHAPFAFWSFQPADQCVNSFPTPDHFDKCNSLQEAAAKADEYFLTQPNVCFAQTTPDGGGYLQNPAGGAATLDSRNWFADYLGISVGRVTIRQFSNPMETLLRFHHEDCGIDNVATGYSITVLEYGYCPHGLFDDDDNRSPVSGSVRKRYPFECSNQALDSIEVRKALPTASCARGEGNPCDPLTGNKRIAETDFEHHSLPLIRYYHSLDLVQSLSDVGRGWNHNYDARITVDSGTVMAHLPDGSVSHFGTAADGTTWVSDQLSNVLLYLPTATTAELHYPNGDVWFFEGVNGFYDLFLTARRDAADAGRSITLYRDAFQRVTDVVDASGRSLKFHYQGGGLTSVDLPDGEQIRYAYDVPAESVHNRLVQVQYPDGAAIEYRYEDSRHPYHVTAIIDEMGNAFAAYVYDETGKVVMSEHAGGAGRVELSYDGLDTTVITPGGDARVYDGDVFGGYHGNQFPSYNGIADGAGARTVIWRPGFPRRMQSQTNAEGHQALYQYDAWSRITSTTHAAGSPEEIETVLVWDAVHNRVEERREPGVTTTYSYDGQARLLNRTLTDTETTDIRSWTYRYFEPPASAPLIGRLQSVDGPRTDVADVTTYEYYDSDHPSGDYLVGDLAAVVNALGQRMEYLKYDGNGRPVRIRDANGVLTEMSYHPRGWLQSRTTDGQTTTFSHDAAGNLTRVTQADGSFVWYEYDEAQRITALGDNFDNRLQFTLDASGNRVSEETLDASGTLRRQLSRVYDQVGRLASLIDGNGDVTRFSYDNNGNRTGETDANQNSRHHEFDALDRWVKTVDAALGETLVEYDDRHNRIGATDPLGNVTRYHYDGLGNHTGLDSPDSGASSHEYDAAGNRISSTDARGVRTEYRYDALNRLTEINHADDSLDVRFTYDTGPNGKGRLTRMEDAGGAAVYTYDRRGNIVSETRTVGSDQYVTSYTYNASDRLTGMTYPSGLSLDFSLDAAGRVVAIDQTFDNATESLANNVEYAPFGPMVSFTYGNGADFAVTLNADYELDHLRSGPDLDWRYHVDATGNITAIDDRVDDTLDQAFQYDDLDRLVTAQGGYPTRHFEYDVNANRTRFRSGTTDESYVYESQSNRLAAHGGWTFARDSSGNRVSKLDDTQTGQIYTYSAANRLSAVSLREGAGDMVVGSYVYDGRGQRVSKTAGGKTIHFIYGPSGELLGEYTVGALPAKKEYIYLNGRPVAMHVKERTLRQPPPRLFTIDNDDALTSSTGSWSIESSEMALGGDYRRARKRAGNSYRWTFQESYPGSTFRVLARWVSHKSFSSDAEYSIKHENGIDRVQVDQKSGGGQWRELGVFSFSGTEEEWVELSVSTGKISADAVRFEEIVEPEIVEVETTLFIHSDHLGTPRRVSDGSVTTVWRWDSSPFGLAPPDQDPDGNFQELVLNLRHPGQYYEGESGLMYNYHRSYDPETGRYLESDPIGLAGGLNTFGYVEANPIRWSDALGLATEFCSRPFFPIPVPYARHCFLKYDDGRSSSFGPRGPGSDPAPDWWPKTCQATEGAQADDCMQREMENCRAEQYDFFGFNCCHCVEKAMKACGAWIPNDDWPNWPVNPGPQPGEPGFGPRAGGGH